jgi:hypothetical protein
MTQRPQRKMIMVHDLAGDSASMSPFSRSGRPIGDVRAATDDSQP